MNITLGTVLFAQYLTNNSLRADMALTVYHYTDRFDLTELFTSN